MMNQNENKTTAQSHLTQSMGTSQIITMTNIPILANVSGYCFLTNDSISFLLVFIPPG